MLLTKQFLMTQNGVLVNFLYLIHITSTISINKIKLQYLLLKSFIAQLGEKNMLDPYS